MWFGMQHLVNPPEEAGAGEQVLLMVWKPDWTRAITVVCPAETVGSFIRLLRAVAEGAPTVRPRCDACGATLDLPDIDAALEEEAPCPSP